MFDFPGWEIVHRAEGDGQWSCIYYGALKKLTVHWTGGDDSQLRPCPTTSLEIKVEGWEMARKAYLLVTACHKAGATTLELLELLQLLK